MTAEIPGVDPAPAGGLDRRQFLTRLAAVAALGAAWQPAAASAQISGGLLARRRGTYESLIEALAGLPSSPVPTTQTAQVSRDAASALADVFRIADARFQTNVNAFLDVAVGKTDFTVTTDADVARFQAASARDRRDAIRRSLRSPQERVLRPGSTAERPIRGSFSPAILAAEAVRLALAPFPISEFVSPMTDHPVLTFLLDKEG